MLIIFIVLLITHLVLVTGSLSTYCLPHTQGSGAGIAACLLPSSGSSNQSSFPVSLIMGVSAVRSAGKMKSCTHLFRVGLLMCSGDRMLLLVFVEVGDVPSEVSTCVHMHPLQKSDLWSIILFASWRGHSVLTDGTGSINQRFSGASLFPWWALGTF